MNIYIVSNDERYKYLCDALKAAGHNTTISEPQRLENADAVIFSVRDELTREEYEKVLLGLNKETIVFSGGQAIINELFSGRVVNYSQNEDFLLKNAYLTAEAFLSIWHKEVKESPLGKSVLIVGYGRIGKSLAKIFSNLGASVNIYARREAVREEVKNDGYVPVLLEEFSGFDAIINTAPSVVFDKKIINEIPSKTYLFDLASNCGFEDSSKVIFALGLPGKILPKSAANVIYDTIKELLS